jgi:two-component system phosphate regulon sensor histidine kinase PhoR
VPSDEPSAESIPLHRQPVDVAVLVELTTEVMQLQARKLGVTLTIRVDDNVPDVLKLDRDKVAWAITNLVGSALRHVRTPGGAIVVHVGYDAERATLQVSVRDDGPGIPPDRLKRLLERAIWHPGSALGLLLVEDIAVAHGGGLVVDSSADRVDHFMQVSFTIPVSVS